VVHVCLTGALVALYYGDRDFSRRRVAALLARIQRHRDHLQSTVDQRKLTSGPLIQVLVLSQRERNLLYSVMTNPTAVISTGASSTKTKSRLRLKKVSIKSFLFFAAALLNFPAFAASYRIVDKQNHLQW